MSKELSVEKLNEIYLLIKPPVSFISTLKLDLSLRENNEHAGSGLGGNPSQFLYLMTRNIKSLHSKDGNVHVHLDNGDLVFTVPQDVKLLPLREALNRFWETCPNKEIATFKQLKDVSFLKDLCSDRMDIWMLIQALDVANELVVWLDRAKQFMTSTSDFFHVEKLDLERQFLLDMGLPADYLTKVRDLEKERSSARTVGNEPDHISIMMRDHPVWGSKLKNLKARKDAVLAQILSEQDIQKLNMIGSFPDYISTFVLRSVIELDRIVVHNLDEKAKWIDDVNKILSSLAPDKS